jgi:hypothetical protein
MGNFWHTTLEICKRAVPGFILLQVLSNIVVPSAGFKQPVDTATLTAVEAVGCGLFGALSLQISTNKNNVVSPWIQRHHNILTAIASAGYAVTFLAGAYLALRPTSSEFQKYAGTLVSTLSLLGIAGGANELYRSIRSKSNNSDGPSGIR